MHKLAAKEVFRMKQRWSQRIEPFAQTLKALSDLRFYSCKCPEAKNISDVLRVLTTFGLYVSNYLTDTDIQHLRCCESINGKLAKKRSIFTKETEKEAEDRAKTKAEESTGSSLCVKSMC